MNKQIRDLILVIIGTLVLGFGAFFFLLVLTNIKLRLLYCVFFLGMFVSYWYGRLWTFIWNRKEGGRLNKNDETK